MIKTITVGNVGVRMRATASTPRLYRIKFKRDIFKDMQALKSATNNSDPENSGLSVEDLTVFENVAYIMALQGDYDDNGNRIGNVPGSAEEWLDSFDGIFSIYEALPQIIELWGENLQTTSKSKKK